MVCAIAGCTRPNPGFGEDASGTGSGTSEASMTDTTRGQTSTATTKPMTSSDDADATGLEGTMSGTSATQETGNDDNTSDDDHTDSDPLFDIGRNKCGNGEVEEGEQCEQGADPGLGCQSMGLGPGVVECVDCIIVTHCCGDGVLEDPEICEAGESVTCPVYGGFENVQATCTEQCTVPIDGCPRCGDEDVQPAVEDCDFPGGSTCEQEGLQGGEGNVTCNGCVYQSQMCCILPGEPCSLDDGIACCDGECDGGACPFG